MDCRAGTAVELLRCSLQRWKQGLVLHKVQHHCECQVMQQVRINCKSGLVGVKAHSACVGNASSCERVWV